MFKPILVILLLLTAAVSIPLDKKNLSINKYGMLLIDGKSTWTSNNFEQYGYQVVVDIDSPIAEGSSSKNTNEYDINIEKGRKVILYYEINDNKIYRGVLLDRSIPVNLKETQIFIGDPIHKAVSLLGNYKVLHGEDVGSYFSFDKYKKLSFYTECNEFSWEIYQEERDQLKVNSLKEYGIKKGGLQKCKIEKILFLGDKERKSWVR